MTTHQFERTVRPSVLDRLIDDPENREPRNWDESVVAFKNAVMRDLQWLLNTRRVHPPAPAALDLVQRSIYHFGLRDLSSRGSESMQTRLQLQREVQDAIALFEPRLSKLRVTMVPPNAEDRRIRFQIEAELRTDPDPATVVFETTLDPSRSALDVKDTGDA